MAFSLESNMNFDIMDRISYEYYSHNGPKPNWSESQWQNLRVLQSQRSLEEAQKADQEWLALPLIQRKEKLMRWKVFYNIDDKVFNDQLINWEIQITKQNE